MKRNKYLVGSRAGKESATLLGVKVLGHPTD